MSLTFLPELLTRIIVTAIVLVTVGLVAITLMWWHEASQSLPTFLEKTVKKWRRPLS